MSKWWVNGNPFTCENKRFKTNVAKGYAHGQAAAKGSVFPTALISGSGYSLWLEHVVDKEEESEWLAHVV